VIGKGKKIEPDEKGGGGHYDLLRRSLGGKGIIQIKARYGAPRPKFQRKGNRAFSREGRGTAWQEKPFVARKESKKPG